MTFKHPFLSIPGAVARRPFVTSPDEVVRRTLEDGWADVRADEVGSLWARVRPGEGPAAVICAHLDAVFDDIETAQPGTGLRCAAATITGWERGAQEGGGA
jgi:hypothetical protein